MATRHCCSLNPPCWMLAPLARMRATKSLKCMRGTGCTCFEHPPWLPSCCGSRRCKPTLTVASPMLTCWQRQIKWYGAVCRCTLRDVCQEFCVHHQKVDAAKRCTWSTFVQMSARAARASLQETGLVAELASLRGVLARSVTRLRFQVRGGGGGGAWRECGWTCSASHVLTHSARCWVPC